VKRILLGAIATAAVFGWLARYDRGTGMGDDHNYAWQRFDVGDHILEIHVGRRS
jgi:hypothetical protein